MKVNFVKLSNLAKDPFRGTEFSAGYDLFASSVEEKPLDNLVVYGTGIALEIPPNHVGLIFPRSSISKYNLSLANSVGVIDSDYRGEIKFVFNKLGPKIYEVGDRIGQIIILPYPEIEFNLTQQLNENLSRGTGGFGSTGQK